MLEIRRRTDEAGALSGRETADQGGSNSEETHPAVSRVLAELLGDGTIPFPEDDGDEEYIDVEEGDEDEEGEEDEVMDIDGDFDDDEEADLFGYRVITGHAHTPNRRWHEEVTEPKEAGLSLLFSGEFGRIQHQLRSRSKAGNVARLLLNRGSKVRLPPREDYVSVGTTGLPATNLY